MGSYSTPSPTVLTLPSQAPEKFLLVELWPCISSGLYPGTRTPGTASSQSGSGWRQGLGVGREGRVVECLHVLFTYYTFRHLDVCDWRDLVVWEPRPHSQTGPCSVSIISHYCPVVLVVCTGTCSSSTSISSLIQASSTAANQNTFMGSYSTPTFTSSWGMSSGGAVSMYFCTQTPGTASSQSESGWWRGWQVGLEGRVVECLHQYMYYLGIRKLLHIWAFVTGGTWRCGTGSWGHIHRQDLVLHQLVITAL